MQNPMTGFRVLLLLLNCSFFLLQACSSSDQEAAPADGQGSENQGVDSDDNAGNGVPAGDSTGDTTVEFDSNSLAPGGCQNVVIINEFAYAACGTGIEVVNLNSMQRNFIPVPADDITGDDGFGILFTQSGNTLTQLDLADPLAPDIIATVNTNFAIFSGISAANGILVVSGGSGGSDTQVYLYDFNSLSLSTSGIAQVDSATGNPDVHVTATANGALAFYSQDIGLVANWGIQIVEFDADANILDIPAVVVLTPGRFTGSFGFPFGPANLPVESEFLNDRLYVAHFAANGLQVIDRLASDTLSLIPLGYEPSNVATDGTQLFVVGVDRTIIDTVNPVTETVVDSFSLPLRQAVGVAANDSHIAVADRSAGLIIVTR